MSSTAFSRFFKTGAGHNFVAYPRKLKIAEACRMLSDADTPVTEIRRRLFEHLEFQPKLPQGTGHDADPLSKARVASR